MLTIKKEESSHKIRIVRSTDENGKDVIQFFVDGEECDKVKFGQKVCGLDPWLWTIFDAKPTLVRRGYTRQFDWPTSITLFNVDLWRVHDEIVRRIREVREWHEQPPKYEEINFTI